MSANRHIPLFTAACVITGLLALSTPNAARADVVSEAVSSIGCTKWTTAPLTPEEWEVVYDGHGEVTFTDGVTLSPMPSTSKDETHAALALLKNSPTAKSFAVRIRYENVRPLRSPASQPWETFWLFFDYKPDGTKKRTNYLIHKPNGMELGRAWNETHQEYVATTREPAAEVGRSYEMTLVRERKRVRAFIDGKLALESTNTAQLESSGRIGLYTEDSRVHVTSVDFCNSTVP
jgi:hypothetical protein